MYHKIARKLQQQQDDSLPQQLTPEVLEKMRTLQEILEYHINILQIPKSEIHPGLKDKLPSYERRILIFVNSNRSIRQRGLN
ncbi:mediator of RNA polymerase II transcription subunit 15a-like [Punica granatum]|nr:mediator of RNA polymerase II transcription subunit 15a-like [Punica granatum]